MDYLNYQRLFSLERQGFSQVARQVAEGSGWTTSTTTDMRRACPRGMKALSYDAKLAGAKSPQKEKARFCRVVFLSALARRKGRSHSSAAPVQPPSVYRLAGK